MKQELIDFAKLNSWQYGMDNSKGLDSWGNYSGGMDKPDWVILVSRSRDSGMMEDSNFESSLDLLGGLSKHVAIERFGHWACGWFELLLVSPKSFKYLAIAKSIKDGLADHPLVDEDDYFKREWEYQSNYANGAKADLADALSKHFGVKHTKLLENIAYDLNIEQQAYGGNDSCIDIYASREPDLRDLQCLLDRLNEANHKFPKSTVYKKLLKAVEERVKNV